MLFLLNCRAIVAIAIPFQGKKWDCEKRGMKGSVSKAEGIVGYVDSLWIYSPFL